MDARHHSSWVEAAQAEEQPVMQRRGFLRLGIGGAALLVTSGGILSWFLAGYKSRLGKDDLPVSLSIKEFAVVRAFVQTLFPESDGFPSGESLGIPQRFDEEVWAGSSQFRSNLKNGLQVLEHAPAFKGFGSRFVDLNPEDRVKFYHNCLTGNSELLRQLSVGLRQMAHFFYYSHPSVWPLIGYEGPFVATPVPPESHFAYQAMLQKMRRA